MNDHRKAKAVRLRAEGWQYKDIAELLDVSRSTIYRWVNPTKVALHEQKRRAAKERWHRDHYHGVCQECGGDTSARVVDRCQECRRKDDQARHDALLDEIERLYNAGVSLRDIAVAVGHKPSAGALGRELRELRATGRIGYRLSETRRERMRQARWGNGTDGRPRLGALTPLGD